jgi:hypothetical protein
MVTEHRVKLDVQNVALVGGTSKVEVVADMDPSQLGLIEAKEVQH